MGPFHANSSLGRMTLELDPRTWGCLPYQNHLVPPGYMVGVPVGSDPYPESGRKLREIRS
jgi:hypothetical protein